MPDQPLVYIIVLNWNGWQDTVECINSLNELSYDNYRLIVVDNGSKDGSVKKLIERFPDLRIHQTGDNLGYAGGNNAGIRIAMSEGCDYVWILNNDTIVDRDSLRVMVNKMEMNPDAGLCGATLVYADHKEVVQAMGGGSYNRWLGTTKNIGDGWDLDSINDVDTTPDFIAGASVLVSNKFLEEIGLMNEEYFLYYEEIDWAVRSNENFSLIYAKESIVYHKEGSSTKGNRNRPSSRSLTADFYQLRNRLRFTKNHTPYCLPTVYATVVAALFIRILKGRWKHIPIVLSVLIGHTPTRFRA